MDKEWFVMVLGFALFVSGAVKAVMTNNLVLFVFLAMLAALNWWVLGKPWM